MKIGSLMLAEIDKRLAGWKGNTLCGGGRLILVNVVLSSMPLYMMTFHKLPALVMDRIDRMRRNFFLERR